MTRRTVSQVAEQARDALIQFGPVAGPDLVQVLRNGDPDACWAALVVLKPVESNAAVVIPEVVRCLKDRNYEVALDGCREPAHRPAVCPRR